MANVNSPNGFRVVKHATGGLANRRQRYHIASAYSSNIATNDAVVPTGSGKLILLLPRPQPVPAPVQPALAREPGAGVGDGGGCLGL